MPLPSLPPDKAQHFFYGSATSVAVFFCAVHFLPAYAAWAAFGAAALAGIVKEAWDYRTAGAVSEPLDAVWTAAGGLPFVAVALVA